MLFKALLVLRKPCKPVEHKDSQRKNAEAKQWQLRLVCRQSHTHNSMPPPLSRKRTQQLSLPPKS